MSQSSAVKVALKKTSEVNVYKSGLVFRWRNVVVSACMLINVMGI